MSVSGVVLEPFLVDFQAPGTWVGPQWRDPTQWFPSAGGLEPSHVPCASSWAAWSIEPEDSPELSECEHQGLAIKVARLDLQEVILSTSSPIETWIRTCISRRAALR